MESVSAYGWFFITVGVMFGGVLIGWAVRAWSPFFHIRQPAITNALGGSNITSTSATVNGEVVATGGEDPWVFVCYGQTNARDTFASWEHRVDLGATKRGPFSWTITDLAHSTHYYFRSFARNSGGKDCAKASGSFETRPPVAPTVQNGEATSITHDSAILNGQVVETGGEDPRVWFLWGTKDRGVNQQEWQRTYYVGKAGRGLFSHALEGLVPANTYYFRVVCGNSAGVRWAPTTASFRTKAVVVPAHVRNGRGATRVTADSATLHGEVLETGGEAPRVLILWGEADGGVDVAQWYWQEELGRRGQGPFFHTLQQLTRNTPYYYRVYAVNSAGSSWSGETVSFTTPT